MVAFISTSVSDVKGDQSKIEILGIRNENNKKVISLAQAKTKEMPINSEEEYPTTLRTSNCYPKLFKGNI